MSPFFWRQHNLGDTACGCPRIQKTTTFFQTFVPKGKHSTKYHHHENNSSCVGKEEEVKQQKRKYKDFKTTPRRNGPAALTTAVLV